MHRRQLRPTYHIRDVSKVQRCAPKHPPSSDLQVQQSDFAAAGAVPTLRQGQEVVSRILERCLWSTVSGARRFSLLYGACALVGASTLLLPPDWWPGSRRGMAYIQSKLRLPMVMHNRQFSPINDYIKHWTRRPRGARRAGPRMGVAIGVRRHSALGFGSRDSPRPPNGELSPRSPLLGGGIVPRRAK